MATQVSISMEDLVHPPTEASKRLSASKFPAAVVTRPFPSVVREAAFIFVILCAQLMTTAGIGMGIAPLHIIGDHFGVTNPGERSWYIAAYSLTVGTFILPAGRLGDMVGHKKIFVGAYAWYGVWSLLCGAGYYSNDIFFSTARGFQGIGPAFIAPNALALVGRIYPEGMRKNLVFAFYGACAPAGYVIGAAFSSLLAQRAYWAWAYWIMGIVCFMYSVAGIIVIPDPDKGSPVQTVKQKFDYLGALTGVSGLVLVNVAWNQGPTVGWQTPYTYILLIIGILCLAAFVLVERKVDQPLLPVTTLKAPILFILSATAVGWASFGIWLYYLWEFLLTLRHHSPLLASAQNAPAAITGFIASITTGLLINNVPIPYIMILALLAFIITPVLTATMPIDQTYWAQTFVSTILIPFGMDMSFPAATIILSSSVPKEHQGIAASLVLTVTQYSISLGLGIAGTVAVEIDKSGTDLLKQFRSAFYTSIGLSGLGIAIAIASAWYYKKHPLPAHH
ncbi:MAG: hypothetical protein LQ342_006698 [Letrouitia transgressa]|nr:MAG: hypothetical protein LQ342_006698 [Letrouitia transgressa]